MSSATPAPRFVVGVDVGTSSARAAVVDSRGHILAVDVQPLVMHSALGDQYEYASGQVWSAVVQAVRNAVTRSGVLTADIVGIGFDATCSLVVTGKEDEPLSVSSSPSTAADELVRDVIVWMDHRSVAQAAAMTATKHAALDSVGGVMSPEMHLPKIAWLKKHKPDTFARAERFMDLTDWLAYRASGQELRSVCTITCKMTYQAHLHPSSEKDKPAESSSGGWLGSFFNEIGLSEFPAEDWRRIGSPSKIRAIGSRAGVLRAEVAAAMGLDANTVVSVGLIDAHAGGIGTIGATLPEDIDEQDRTNIEQRMAVICGTSTCHMSVSASRIPVPGVWGPCKDAMVPGYWLLEGGESATGALVDHIVDSHPASGAAKAAAQALGVHLHEYFHQQLLRLQHERGLEDLDLAFLTRDVHVLPYFHGNRSPRADPSLTGVVSGLTLACGLDDLAVRYLATLQALAYGTRHIIQSMRECGKQTRFLFLSGGLAKNRLFVQQHADATGCVCFLPRESDGVLVGAAMTAACASSLHPSLPAAMAAMSSVGATVRPASSAGVSSFHDRKYAVFLRMHEDQQAWKRIMTPQDENDDSR